MLLCMLCYNVVLLVRDYGGDGAISKYMQLPVEQYIMVTLRTEQHP